MDRYWLLTCTCYGTWLPGDARGFVGHVRDHREEDNPSEIRVSHGIPGTPCDEDMPGLERACREHLKGPPVDLTLAHAQAALAQFQETAHFRRWSIEAVAIMHNHFHLVVGVRGDPEPGKILGGFKSWATRALTRQFGAPLSQTWWTERGSKRKLKDEAALQAAILYVLFKQRTPLLTWSPRLGLNPPPPTSGAA
jgi:REP element-mobilizing transposase RayT